MKVSISGVSVSPVTLQASFDLKTWTDLQTFTLTGTEVVYTDAQAATTPTRHYRLKQGSTTAVTLPDLANSPNTVFTAGEGFDTVQYAANGNLGLIFWKDRNLMMRERTSGGNWVEQTVTAGGNLFQSGAVRQYVNFQPAALLLYDGSSTPHVFKHNGGTTIGHFVRLNGSWAQVETINANGASGTIGLLVGAVGANNVFHLATISTGGSPNLVYGSNKAGSWNWSTVTSIGAEPYWTPGSYNRRSFGMAVDSRNAAHIVYRPAFTYTYHPEGYMRAYNELNYASNASGQWRTQLVAKPTDVSGEAATGATIAVGPNDKPAIASWFNDRGDGGSASWSRLHYHQQDSAGNWSASIVTSRPDGYIAGDGEKGCGAAPYLRFDAQGRAHILFLDQAAQHFPMQNEYVGNVRHAWWNGSQWLVENVLRQSKPLEEQVVFTGFALRGNEMAVTALRRGTVWNTSVNPQVATSSYRFSFLTKPLP